MIRHSCFDEYRPQNRGGLGLKTMNCTDKTGRVVNATTVTDADELMIMTTGGQSVRIKVDSVRETGRNTQGVKLVTLNDKESIQDISLVIADDDDDDAEGESTEGEAEAPETPEADA